MYKNQGGIVMAEKKKINVTIDGRNFAIVGTEDEKYIKDLAYYVDKKITGLTSKNDKLSRSMSATLAALHIADELYKSNEDYSILEERAKDPLEQYDSVCEKLNEAEMKIESYEKVLSDYQENIVEHTSQKEKLADEISKYEEELEEKDRRIDDLEERIKGLQDKNFKNQLELIEIKKELADYLRLLESETSTD